MQPHLDTLTLIDLLFLFVIAIFLGVELIAKVPSILHTPLMSGSNAISGITIVGALLSTGLTPGSTFCTVLGTLAVSNGSIVWFPKGTTYGYKMGWSKFDRTMQGETARVEKR